MFLLFSCPKSSATQEEPFIARKTLLSHVLLWWQTVAYISTFEQKWRWESSCALAFQWVHGHCVPEECWTLSMDDVPSAPPQPHIYNRPPQVIPPQCLHPHATYKPDNPELKGLL